MQSWLLMNYSVPLFYILFFLFFYSNSAAYNAHIQSGFLLWKLQKFYKFYWALLQNFLWGFKNLYLFLSILDSFIYKEFFMTSSFLSKREILVSYYMMEPAFYRHGHFAFEWYCKLH